MKFQLEQPSEKDLFEGGGHENTAIALENVLENHSDVSTFGLQGELGAGKSTVLRILERNLKDKKYSFIYFDVDKYHHSSIKAAFIKVFSSELIRIIGKNTEEVEEAKNKALGNILSYDKETDSKITIWVVLFVYTLFLSMRNMKEAVLFVKPTISSVFSGNYSIGFDETITALFALSPGLLVFFYLCARWLKPLLMAKFFRSKNRIKKGVDLKIKSFGVVLGNLLHRNGTDTVTEKMLINKEVGSFELKEAFEVFSNAIPVNSSVVLIIDNLDRVDSENFKEVWSDLEIFTEYSKDSLKIIVPFSERQVLKAFLDKDHEFGREFISKRLPVVFRVPPIVSTGWRNQFAKYWQETLPGQDGIEKCSDLIDIWVGFDRHITPRLLKKHVNDIASILISSPESKPNTVVCSAYILSVVNNNVLLVDLTSKEKFESDETASGSKILKSKIIETQKTLNSILNIDAWSGVLYKIHYQTTLEHAKSELLGIPVSIAVKNLDHLEILKLSGAYGFDLEFKKQVNTDNAKNLVKIASEINKMSADVDNKNKSIADDWLNNWLGEISDEFKQINLSSDKADEILLSSIKGLSGKADFDISPVYQAKDDFLGLFDNLKHITEEFSQEDMLVVDNLYHYCSVLDLTPAAISSPAPAIFVNFLWPNKERYVGWAIKKIDFDIEDLHQIIFLCAEKSNIKFDEKEKLLEWVADRYRISSDEWRKEGEYLDSLVDESNEESDQLALAVYHSDWKLGNTYLAEISFALDSSDKTKANADAENTALLFAGMLASGRINTNYSKYHLNRHQGRINAIAWVELSKHIKANPSYTEYLAKYLTFVPFHSIVNVFLDEDKSEYISKAIKDLIVLDKVHELDVSVDVFANYHELSGLFDNEKSIFLNWLENWLGSFSDMSQVKELPPEFIEDSFDANKTEYIDVINNVISQVEERDWKTLFLDRQRSIEVYVSKLQEADSKLADKAGKSLISTLENYFLEEDIGSVTGFEGEEWVTSLLNVINTNDRDKIVRKLNEKLSEIGFEKARKFAIIRNFSQFVIIPPSESDASQDMALGLFDDADEKTFCWLCNQKWSFSKWDKDRLVSLRNTLVSADFDCENLPVILSGIENNIGDQSAEPLSK